MPPNAMVAGKDRNAQPLYVCRVQYEGGVYPGVLAGPAEACSIPYSGKEYRIANYEILTGKDYSWAPAYNGEVPFDALVAGIEPKGTAVYICRGEVNSEWCPGKISQADGGCRVTHAGKELTALWYEVLVGS